MSEDKTYVVANDMASDAQLSSEQTREIAQERDAQALRRANFEGYHRGAEIDLGFRQGLERNRQQAAQEERNGAYRQILLDQQKQLDEGLKAQGVRKFLRDVSGRSDADRAARDNVQRSLEDMQYREQQEASQLQARHDREEQHRAIDMEQRKAYIDQQQELENQARTQQQRQQGADVRATVTPANMNEEPHEPALNRPAAEQQNTAPVAQDFNDQSRQSVSELRAAYIAADQRQEPETPRDRQAYIEEQQSPEHSPAHDFQHAAPAPSHGRQR